MCWVMDNTPVMHGYLWNIGIYAHRDTKVAMHA